MKKIRTKFIIFSIYIGKALLNTIYFFVKICPTKNKIVMLSRQLNKKSLDFKLIKEEILKRNQEVELVILCKTLKEGLKDRIGYLFYILKCMYHIATAKVCVIDGYSIPISILKHKKNLEIIQIWHASGATKKFGYQSLGKKEGRSSEIAKMMNMHKNYDHVMAPSSATAKFYEEAFKVDKEKIFINGLPRIDYILDETLGKDKIDEFNEEYPGFKNKKTILYVPTFRKDKNKIESIKKLVENVDFCNYNLIIKLHPLDESEELEKYTVDRKYSTYDLIKIADYIITDYSAVSFEASLLCKPIYFYLYDIEEYKETRGLNVDLLKEMSSCSRTDIKEIIRMIENNKYNYDELNKFKNKYMEINSTDNTTKLVDFIFKYLNKDVSNE